MPYFPSFKFELCMHKIKEINIEKGDNNFGIKSITFQSHISFHTFVPHIPSYIHPTV